MSFRSTLSVGNFYDSRYSPVQTRYNYTKSIQQLHSQIRKQREEEFRREKEEAKRRQKELEVYQGKYTRLFWTVWSKTFSKLGDDWVFLAFLGIFVAIISYTVDKGIQMCTTGRMWLYTELAENMFSKWVAWICLPFCLILWDVGLTHLVAPQAAGSGIPQIKTSLRGVFMKEFLTYKILIAKWLGITATIGSGMPLGKEGPLIHMSSIIVTKMSNALSTFNQVFINESKKIEMLGAAWAVGVACTFNAPIGGVLFSVEITTAYYAVRNYWRGFFAAVWGATTYRLLLVWIDGVDTIKVVFPTSFFVDFPYDPFELISFAILGVICGLSGSFYIWCKQCFSQWYNRTKFINKIQKFNRFICPGFIVLLVSTVTWPPGIGQFMAAQIAPGTQVIELFSNFTWTKENLTVTQTQVVSHWSTEWSGIYTSLVVYICYQFIFSILASSMPIPCGSFIPVFRAGAALGRIAGELMHLWFPLGVRYKGVITQIMPGAYATVGAASFAGAVTHTMSVCVILFEMTSQITHVIPVLISVLISNGIARVLTPSIYDLVIISNKLPYLPDLLPSTSAIYEVYVEDFMVKNVKFAFLGMTYAELKNLLLTNRKHKVFPLVDHPQNMTLLGSVPREELVWLIDRKIGIARRRQVLPSPSIGIHKEEEDKDKEAGPSTKTKESIAHIDDSSDSEFEEKKKKSKRELIFEKWGIDRKKPSTSPKSPMSGGKSASTTHLEVSVIRVCDLPMEKQMEWEDQQMKDQVDFATVRIDPAPFQLVERTSLLKVHSIFSMLAINFAYVTSIGKLVGVVTLEELRKAIEEANSGKPPKKPLRAPASPLPMLAQTPILARTTSMDPGGGPA
ncbi:chloride channel protein 2 [Anoplophora glabripennis]|nr:chloride channel protein 2 [Anoplophora glabripennis]